MTRILAILGLAALVAGCGATSKAARAPTTLAGTLGYRASPPAPSGPLMVQASQPDAPARPAMPARKLLCDAPSLTYLVGRPRTEIPVPADLSHRRVVCASCPSSDDYRPDRTDIVFDPKTGVITAVTCG